MKENFSYLKDVLGVKYVPRRGKGAVAQKNLEDSTKHQIKASDVTVKAEKQIEQKKHHPPAAENPFKDKTMEELEKIVSKCFDCKLSKTRNKTVFGSGSHKAKLMFIGEGPGADEDEQGLPFVGRAGQLLTKMINAMGLQREDVYIANVVKCRPPENRKPQGDEVGACENYLFAQIANIKPDLMIALGATAMECLLKTEEKIGEKRGKILPFLGRKLMITYHPAYLLRNPPAKKYVWEDLQVAMKELGLKSKSTL